MFRKPKQRNLRGRTDLDTNEDDPSTVPSTASVVKEQPVVTFKPVVKKTDAPKSLLSFVDDEGKSCRRKRFYVIVDCSIVLGDTEEFKVNKTRESRKMAKEMKKQHQHISADAKLISVDEPVIITTATTVVEENVIMKEDNNKIGRASCRERVLNLV